MLVQRLSQVLGSLKSGFKSLVPLFILIIYTVIGAALFIYLEGPNELHTLETLKRDREQLMENTAFRLNNIRAMTPISAYNHTIKTLQRYQAQLGVDNVVAENQQWTFFGSIFYCIAVYTTIGYGNIVPMTTPGRVMTVLYALVGIPLTLTCLVGLGAVFAKLCKFLWGLIAKSTRVISKDLEKKIELGTNEKNGANDDDLLSFPIFFLVFLTVLWIFACAGIFLIWEKDWDYGTSLYYTFISFSTIGFGDILPSEYDYMIVVGVMLLIGLSLVSTMLNIIQQQLEALAKGMQDNIDKEYMTALAEAQDEGEVVEAPPADVEAAAGGEGADLAAHRASMDPRSLDAVISRMPFRSRIMYHIMPENSKKHLQEHSEVKMKYRNRGCQTSDDLLREYALEKYKEEFKAVNVVVVQDFSGQETPSTTVFHGDVTSHHPTHQTTHYQPHHTKTLAPEMEKSLTESVESQPYTPKPKISETHTAIPIKFISRSGEADEACSRADDVRVEHVPVDSTERYYEPRIHYDDQEEQGSSVQMLPQQSEMVHVSTTSDSSEEESEEYVPTQRTATLIFPKPASKDVKDTDV